MRRSSRLRRLLRRSVRIGAAAALSGLVAFAAAWLLFPFPRAVLATRSGSPAVLDREGRPLRIRTDGAGQWRLPVPLGRMSPDLLRATIAVEDRRFRAHPGVDPVAAIRAAVSNLASGRVVSGASTITMQLCRMLRPRPRTLATKAVESFRALQLERILTKDQILERYLNLAPYGGNIRGVEAASRIWFGKSAADLSLGEAALLAGLPQSPVRYRPDRHPDAAAARRREVLDRMCEEGMIDAAAADRAAREPVAVRPLPAGDRLSAGVGRHAAARALLLRPAGGRTTIDLEIQRAVESAAARHAASLPPGSDVAVVVIDVETGGIRALVGSADFSDPRDGQVNGALALRSPGSALKPFLYAAAFSTGRLAPDSVVPDRPVDLDGWSPGNFDEDFSGAVTAGEALRRSLNIPALLVTRATGLARSIGLLRAAGLRLPADAESRGGLSLVTGGVEVRLLDLTNAYATLARGGIRRPARLFPDEPSQAHRVLDAKVAAAIDDILDCRHRAPAGYESTRPADLAWFMWKTGTSSRRRDAFAVGHNHRFAIGVWAGAFSGAGRYGYTGATAAEPLLARLFQHPLLRADRAPPAPPKLVATGPFFDERTAPPVAIRTPSPGAVFLSADGEAIVHAAANREKGRWFLDGRAAANGGRLRLSLPRGRHELRFLTPSGDTAAVRFVVR